MGAFAHVDGTTLFHESVGSGTPVVLIHGLALDHRMWDDQIPALSSGHRVIRYDLRGFGRSALPGKEPYSHHDDLRALLEVIGVSRAHVIGLSLGGAIAVDFALAYPALVRSLVLADVSGLGGFIWPEEPARWFASIRAAARDGDLALAKRRWLGTGWFAPAHRNPAVLSRLEEMAADYSGWHFAHDNPVVALSPPANERLGEIGIPTLVLVGELDVPSYNQPIAERLAAGIPGARQVTLAGAGHMSNMEAPGPFNAAVLDFLAAVDARDGG